MVNLFHLSHMSVPIQTTEYSAQTADEGILSSLGLNAQLFAFQLANFLLVIVIVWYLILKPLTKTMEERKKLIDESLDKAREVDTNLSMSERKYQERIDDAKVEANRIIAKAAEDADATAQSLKKKARAEIELLVAQAKKNIEIDRVEMREEIRAEASELVSAAVEKIIREKLDPKKDRKLIDESLKGL